MKKTFLAICISFTFLSSFSQTTIIDSIYVGGMYRDFRIYVPAVYNAANPTPLIFNLHGYTSNNVQQELYADFRPIADTANFILVHPNGTYDQFNNRYWNCFTTIGTGVNDVAFLSALLDSVSLWYNIDADRIYSTGLSNGGFMSNDLACFLSNRIAAIASVAAGMSSIHKSSCNPQHATPVMEIHGTADATVPYNGASGMEPVDSVIKYWRQFNNCNATPLITPVSNISTSDGCTADNYLYNNGANGSTVELYKITNGGHTWPGAFPVATLGNTNQDFKGTVEIWRFFRKYKLSSLVSIEEESLPHATNVFPVPFSDEITVSAVMGLEEVKIYSLDGKLLLSEKNLSQQVLLKLNTTGLAHGIYILELRTPETVAKKLITK